MHVAVAEPAFDHESLELLGRGLESVAVGE
jgi:hypothetical protein